MTGRHEQVLLEWVASGSAGLRHVYWPATRLQYAKHVHDEAAI